MALLVLGLAADTVRYAVSFPDPGHHEARIVADFPATRGDTLEVWMSRSSPGRYALHEFAKNVYAVRAVGVFLSVPGGGVPTTEDINNKLREAIDLLMSAHGAASFADTARSLFAPQLSELEIENLESTRLPGMQLEAGLAILPVLVL